MVEKNVYKFVLFSIAQKSRIGTSQKGVSQIRKIRWIAWILAAGMMLSTVAAQAVEVPSEPALETEQALAQESTADENAAQEYAEEADWRLLLVNPWNQLPAEYQIELKRMTNGLYVDARIYDDLSAMLGACWDAGLHPVVCSAYRSYATQQRLHNNKIYRLRVAGYAYETAVKEAARWVAVPGTSEHQTGMALDIVSYRYQLLNHKQAETPEQQWFMEHCWEYGFILRFPADKCDITGIGYEPWHYRYVGREAALAMRESGQCLEEYLAAQGMEFANAPRIAEVPAEGAADVPAADSVAGQPAETAAPAQ